MSKLLRSEIATIVILWLFIAPADLYGEDSKSNDLNGNGLDLDSIIQCDQIRTIDKNRILKKIGHLNLNIIKKINRAILVSLDLSF